MNPDFIELREGEEKLNPLPSMFTLCNAICGFMAILLTLNAYPSHVGVPPMAVWMIFGAMFFDVFDGLTARLLDARSMHGMNLDSLADAISFGLAPALFIHVEGMSLMLRHDFPLLVIWILPGLYLVCALWRLAVYNTRSVLGIEEEGHIAFVGLPSPAAAGMVACMLWLLPQMEFDALTHFLFYFFYSLIAALLMVSTVTYPHLRNVCARLPRGLTFLIILSALALVVRFGLMALVLLAHLYLLSTPLGRWASKWLDVRENALAEAGSFRD
jgi:CDP-diacylglycerol--serine O-phosphatidyltransferase